MEGNKSPKSEVVVNRGRKILAVVFATLAVTASIAIAISITALLSKGFDSSDGGGVFPFALMLVCVALFFTLPPLINSQFGWKTVVWTYLVQSFFVAIVLVSTVIIVSNISESSSRNRYDSDRYYSPATNEAQ